jgi:hypothetical protein
VQREVDVTDGQPRRRRKKLGDDQVAVEPAEAAAPLEDALPEEPETVVDADDPEKGPFPIGAPWGSVVRDVFRLDVNETFDRLRAELYLGDGALEYGVVAAALDKSKHNAFIAACLTRAAKRADEAYAAPLVQRLEVLRTTARTELDAEKAAGTRSKAPTIQDIDDRMVANWPDEVAAIRSRKEQMHGAFRAIEALEAAWRERSSDLRAIAQRFQSTGRG